MNHGHRKDGTPITDADVEAMADEAEQGYDVDTLLRRRRGGRPPLGSAAASVESVRLDPELKRALLRARRPRARQRLGNHPARHRRIPAGQLTERPAQAEPQSAAVPGKAVRRAYWLQNVVRGASAKQARRRPR